MLARHGREMGIVLPLLDKLFSESGRRPSSVACAKRGRTGQKPASIQPRKSLVKFAHTPCTDPQGGTVCAGSATLPSGILTSKHFFRWRNVFRMDFSVCRTLNLYRWRSGEWSTTKSRSSEDARFYAACALFFCLSAVLPEIIDQWARVFMNLLSSFGDMERPPCAPGWFE